MFPGMSCACTTKIMPPRDDFAISSKGWNVFLEEDPHPLHAKGSHISPPKGTKLIPHRQGSLREAQRLRPGPSSHPIAAKN